MAKEIGILIVVILTVPLYAFADIVETYVSSDLMTYESETGEYHFTGNVFLKKGEREIEADGLIYNPAEHILHLRGNIRYTDERSVITAQRADINIDTDTGSIHNAHVSVKKGDYHISGEDIILQARYKYLMKNAYLTTCDPNSPDWCFYAKEAEIVLQDYMKMTDTRLKIEGFPDIFIPFYYFPLKDKLTGFLLPNFGYSQTKGLYSNLPFYFDIAPNRDATVFLQYYTASGLGQALEYRYIEQGFGKGAWFFQHLSDSAFPQDILLFKGNHRLMTDNGFSALFDVDYVNNNQYYNLYGDVFEVIARRFNRSSGEVSYGTREIRTYLMSDYWVDFENPKAVSYQRLPAAGISINSIALGPLYFSLAGQAAHFFSQDGSLIERLYAAPRLDFSIGREVVLSADAGVRAAAYSTTSNRKDSLSDMDYLSPYYDMTLSVPLSRRYESFTHVIEPVAGYRYMDNDNRFWVTLDSIETLKKASFIYTGINNYLADSNGTFLLAALSLPYSLNDLKNPFGSMVFDLGLMRPITFKVNAAYDFTRDTLTRLNSQIGFVLSPWEDAKWRKIDITIGERYSLDDKILFLTPTLNFDISSSLKFGARVWYDMELSSLRFYELSLNLLKNCYGIDLSFRQSPTAYAIYLVFQLKGIVADKLKVR